MFKKDKYTNKIKLNAFLDKLDLFLNKYDPQFEYDFKLKEDYTEIILKTKITEVEDV